MSVGSDVAANQQASRPAVPDPSKVGDAYGWAREQAALIHAGRFDEIDRIDVTDEIESVGKSEFRSLSRRLSKRVERDLAHSPSLKPRSSEPIEEAYELCLVAARETGLEPEAFPSAGPYDWDTIMMRPFVVSQTVETT